VPGAGGRVTTVLAGALAGMVMGVLSLAPMTILVSNLVLQSPSLRRRLAEGVSLTLLTLAATVAITVAWAILGVILGMAYYVVSTQVPGPGLLSPNAFFTLVMLLAALAFPLAVSAVARRWAWQGVALGALFAGVFGWLLPYLAQ